MYFTCMSQENRIIMVIGSITVKMAKMHRNQFQSQKSDVYEERGTCSKPEQTVVDEFDGVATARRRRVGTFQELQMCSCFDGRQLQFGLSGVGTTLDGCEGVHASDLAAPATPHARAPFVWTAINDIASFFFDPYIHVLLYEALSARFSSPELEVHRKRLSRRRRLFRG